MPLPGHRGAIVDEQGETVPRGGGGYLVLQAPVAVDAAHALGRRRALRQTYWSGSAATSTSPATARRRDEDGDFWLMGRVDDVINVAGHRISTTEVESRARVASRRRRGGRDRRRRPMKGEQIVAFVIPRDGVDRADDAAPASCSSTWRREIGKFARPGMLLFTPDLPKTRSGKIMRRLLRDVAEGRELGDATTLRDPAIVQSIKSRPTASSGASQIGRSSAPGLRQNRSSRSPASSSSCWTRSRGTE